MGAGLVMPYADTQAMSAHLTEISLAVAPGAHALLALGALASLLHRVLPGHAQALRWRLARPGAQVLAVGPVAPTVVFAMRVAGRERM